MGEADFKKTVFSVWFIKSFFTYFPKKYSDENGDNGKYIEWYESGEKKEEGKLGPFNKKEDVIRYKKNGEKMNPIEYSEDFYNDMMGDMWKRTFKKNN